LQNRAAPARNQLSTNGAFLGRLLGETAGLGATSIPVTMHARAGEASCGQGQACGGGGNCLLSLHAWGEVIVISILLAATLHVLLERHRRNK
jgi:hypothetical protein